MKAVKASKDLPGVKNVDELICEPQQNSFFWVLTFSALFFPVHKYNQSLLSLW